jgi:hypothetical protein
VNASSLSLSGLHRFRERRDGKEGLCDRRPRRGSYLEGVSWVYQKKSSALDQEAEGCEGTANCRHGEHLIRRARSRHCHPRIETWKESSTHTPTKLGELTLANQSRRVSCTHGRIVLRSCAGSSCWALPHFEELRAPGGAEKWWSAFLQRSEAMASLTRAELGTDARNPVHREALRGRRREPSSTGCHYDVCANCSHGIAA